jgi:DNA-binding transcriptional ArsR family regulator
VVDVIADEFGITQGAVSQHLRVLRDSGFATVRPEGARRIYTIDTRPLLGVDAWLDRFRGMWVQGLEALATEVARGKRTRSRKQPGK